MPDATSDASLEIGDLVTAAYDACIAFNIWDLPRDKIAVVINVRSYGSELIEVRFASGVVWMCSAAEVERLS